MLNGTGRPRLAHRRSGSACSGDTNARMTTNRPYAARPAAATSSAVESILSLRKWPTTSPTSGATPSQRPKMKDVLTDVRKVGLSPPSTSEIRKLSRLRVNPSVSSAITGVPRAGAANGRDPALQVGSHPLLLRVDDGPEFLLP